MGKVRVQYIRAGLKLHECLIYSYKGPSSNLAFPWKVDGKG